MIKLTMGYEGPSIKIQNFLKNKAVGIAALFFIFAGFLGLEAWKSQTTGATSAVAFNPEEVFAKASTDRKWVLIGDEFTSAQKTFTFSVELSDEFARSEFSLTYAVPGTNKEGAMVKEEDNQFIAKIFIGNLKPGKYTVQGQAKSQAGSFSSDEVAFFVSYPLYVTWTLDWEGYNVPDAYLADLSYLSERHSIPLTHFFNPRIYTSGDLSQERQNYLTSWVKDRKDKNGDAIGLHMHMFPDMVAAAGLTPLASPAWGSTRDDGYDILTSGYSYGETVQLLTWAKGVFEQKGLGIPTVFRAGGWFADGETLQALQDTGFVLDSSGRTKYSFGTNYVAGYWDLLSTSSPYQPNVANQNSSVGPTLDLWEFPNNGADSLAYTTEQLIARFKDNFDGNPLSSRQVVTYLSHPEWFSKDKPRIDGLFSELDKYRNSVDGGPVVYITLERAYQIWSAK